MGKRSAASRPRTRRYAKRQHEMHERAQQGRIAGYVDRMDREVERLADSDDTRGLGE